MHIPEARAKAERAIERLADISIKAGKTGDSIDLFAVDVAQHVVDAALTDLVETARTEHDSEAAYAAVYGESGIDPDDTPGEWFRFADDEPFLLDEDG